MPVLTISNITAELDISLTDEKGRFVSVDSGTVVAYLSGANADADIENKIYISDYSGSGIKAYLYGKEIRAEIPGAVTLNGEKYPSIEKAPENAGQGENEIVLNEDAALNKLVLPGGGNFTIIGNGHTLTLNGITALNAKNDIVLDGVVINAFDKKGKPAALKIKAPQNITLRNVTVNAKSVTLSCKGTLDMSGFGGKFSSVKFGN